MKKIYIKSIARKAEDNENLYSVLASTDSVDRQGDIVDQKGWDLENFKSNPVVLWAHKYDELPVAKAVRIEMGKGGLEMDFEFASAEANPKAAQVKALFDGGFLNAVSVGFIPKERNGNTITKSELLEVSIVPVPANQDALRLAMSKGIDVSALEADIQKGEVEDILNEQEKWEQKWKNFMPVNEVMSALWEAYFNAETPVEDFSKLLEESIFLLDKMTSGVALTEDEEKKVKTASIEKFAEAVLMKEGRVLSKKNRELIKNAIDAQKATVTVLEDLYSATEASSEKGNGEIVQDEPQEQNDKKEEEITLSISDALAIVKGAVRGMDRTNESVLSLINKFQATKKL